MKTILFALLLGWGCCTYGQTNLIPNGSFEEYKELPNNEAQGNYLKEWFNANPGNQHYPNATPDYLHENGSGSAKLPDSYYGYVRPRTGGGVLGLYARKGFVEYMCVKLIKPLVPGKTYKGRFFMTNGLDKYYVKDQTINHNPVGIAFSITPPNQNLGNELRMTPVFSTPEKFFSNQWTEFNYSFTAKEPSQYLIVGYFNPISESYYFFDDFSLIGDESVVEEVVSKTVESVPQPVVITEVNPTEPEKPATPIEPEEPEKTALPKEFKGRKVVGQKTQESNHRQIEIKLYDDKTQDGDIVTVYFNGEPIVERFTVTKKGIKFKINLEPGSNYLLMYAHNLGSIPPNTATIQYKIGRAVHTAHLVSSLNSCGAIEFHYK